MAILVATNAARAELEQDKWWMLIGYAVGVVLLLAAAHQLRGRSEGNGQG